MRRVAAVVVCIAALAGCRLDTTTRVTMQPDGSGEVRVELVADAELVSRITNDGANSIDDVLTFDDAVVGGWVVSDPIRSGDGNTEATLATTTTPTASTTAGATSTSDNAVEPTPTGNVDTSDLNIPDGGAAVVLTHSFAGRDELANVLNSIGPPLSGAAVGRTTEGDQTTNAVRGTLSLNGGYEAFADTDLVQAVGGVPFATELANSTPADTMSFTYRIALPGELVSAGTGSDVGDGVIEWKAPLDGTQLELLVSTVQRPGGGGIWRWVSWLALAALAAWLVFSIVVFTMVVRARRRRQRRRTVRTGQAGTGG